MAQDITVPPRKARSHYQISLDQKGKKNQKRGQYSGPVGDHETLLGAERCASREQQRGKKGCKGEEILGIKNLVPGGRNSPTTNANFDDRARRTGGKIFIVE